MSLAVTSLYAGALGLVYVWLSYRVTVHRRRTKTGLGHGDDPALTASIRVHGNFAEYVPLALVLVGAAEIDGAPAWSIHALGGGLLLGRLLHAIGLSRSPNTSFGRFWGTALTFLVLAVAGGLLLVMGAKALLA